MNFIEKLSILIPAFNEENTIAKVMKRVAEIELINEITKEIIVVNDCSTDKTEQEIQRFISENPHTEVKYFKHEVNRGKGAAIQTAIKNATGEYLIVQDADLEYDPQEFNILLKPVVDGYADVVYGSRFMGGNAHRILFFWHTIGNKFLTFARKWPRKSCCERKKCYDVANIFFTSHCRQIIGQFGDNHLKTRRKEKITRTK